MKSLSSADWSQPSISPWKHPIIFVFKITRKNEEVVFLNIYRENGRKGML